MEKSDIAPRKDPFVIWMLVGIAVLFLASAPLHFIYEWTGKSTAVGLFMPVNESPWEHLKLTFWPVVVWWIIGYLLFLRKKDGGFARFSVTLAVTVLFCTVFITAFFYTYTGAFGIESLVIDIISLFFGLFFGILLARHIYKHMKTGMFVSFAAVVVILVLAAALIYFTFVPPHLPIFKDPPTGTYGI